MKRSIAKGLIFAVGPVLAVAMTASSVSAGWGSHGSGSSGGSSGYYSSGGSSGSHHSSGGSSGSYYSSGGSSGHHSGLFSHLHQKIHRLKSALHHHSSGGYNSSGGSSGTHYKVYGSSGGSSGGSCGSVYMRRMSPAIQVEKPETEEQPATEAPEEDSSARLEVKLPAQARVFVNGKPTSTPGEIRRYVSRNLKPNTTYTYEVRAELDQGDEVLELSQVVELRAGADESIAFDFGSTDELVTSLTLNVPEDAMVTLGGASTKASGAVRQFLTRQLKNGQVWQDYAIVVSVNREGRTITQEKTINLKAGDEKEIDFDFASISDSAQLASARK